MEEEDGDRQEEEVELEKGETSQRGAPMNMTVDDYEMRSELEPRVYVRQSSLTVNKDACSLNACAPRDRWSSVRQRRHWCCAW